MQRRPFLRTLAIIGICCTAARLPAQPSAKVSFARDIQPILERSCFACHGPKIQMSGLRLDAKSGQIGKVILPGNAASSPLYLRVSSSSQLERMPMGGKPLPAAEISLIGRWIDEGAEWPDGVGSST